MAQPARQCQLDIPLLCVHLFGRAHCNAIKLDNGAARKINQIFSGAPFFVLSGAVD